MDKKKLIIMFTAFFAMIGVNALANILPLNGYTTGEVSGMYTVYFTPAGFTFSIWSIIYLALFYWLLTFTLKRQPLTSSLFLLFLATCLFNGTWIIVWHYLLDGVALVTILLHFLSIYVLYRAQKSRRPAFAFTFPVSLYLGWIIVASLTNTQYWLTASIGIGDSLQWGIAYTALLLTGVIGLYFITIEKDITVPLVFIWSLIGIMVKNFPDHMIFTIAAAVCLFILASGVLKYLIPSGKKA